MNYRIGCKKRTVLLCILMICIQLFGLTGCSFMNSLSAVNEPIIDNDLVAGVTYDYVSYRVGESWTPVSSEYSLFVYPGSSILYGVLMYGTYSEYASEQNYFAYVLKDIRESDSIVYANVLEGEEPYTTADGREATISRLRLKQQSPDGAEFYHDADLLILPEEMYFFVFSVAYSEDETVPLDIREVVDTATFDFEHDNSLSYYYEQGYEIISAPDPVSEEEIFSFEGVSFYDKTTDRAVEFADADSFFIYADPDNRSTDYAYGTYTIYNGEEAYEQVYANPEFGSTRDEAEYYIMGTFGQDFPSEFGDHGLSFHDEDFFTIVFETKGFVTSKDDAGIEFPTMYYGFHVRDYDAMVMFDGSYDKYYIWEIEGNEET